MKAIVYEKFGPPEVLHLKEVEKPVPKDNEVLIKVHTASPTVGDWRALRGTPFLVRLMLGLIKPRVKIFGGEIAGQVEVVGRILGHASIGITADIYRHVNRGEMHEENGRFAPFNGVKTLTEGQ